MIDICEYKVEKDDDFDNCYNFIPSCCDIVTVCTKGDFDWNYCPYCGKPIEVRRIE